MVERFKSSILKNWKLYMYLIIGLIIVKVVLFNDSQARGYKGLTNEMMWEMIEGEEYYIKDFAWVDTSEEYSTVISMEWEEIVPNQELLYTVVFDYEQELIISEVTLKIPFVYEQGQWSPSVLEEITQQSRFKEEINISGEQAIKDIENTEVRMNGLGYVFLEDIEGYSMTFIEFQPLADQQEWAVFIENEIEEEIGTITSILRGVYAYEDGEWIMKYATSQEFDIVYREGKAYEFDEAMFRQEYAEHHDDEMISMKYLSGSSGDIICDIEPYNITFKENEYLSLYTNVMRAEVDRSTPLYQEEGLLRATYTYQEKEQIWEFYGTGVEVNFTYDIIGTYSGAYRPYSSSAYPEFDITLEIIEEVEEDMYKGIMTCEVEANERLNLSQVVTYRYPVEIAFNKINVYSENPMIEWQMEVSDDWDTEDQETKKLPRFELEGMIDPEAPQLINKARADRTFTLVKQ